MTLLRLKGFAGQADYEITKNHRRRSRKSTENEKLK
jgi:hypothetical protein